MDKDRVEGGVKEGAGKAKEAWGRVTGDRETQEEGRDEQAEGNLQQGLGHAKDAVRKVIDHQD
jgi:uncharacterized protein YjbJ (UPF0337 family)